MDDRYQGFFIKLGGKDGEILPNHFIRYNTYEVEPCQRLDLDSTRDLTGVMHRNVLAHTATRIDFTVPHIDNFKHDCLVDMLHRNMSDVHSKTITLYYWNDEFHRYDTGKFYMPDIKFHIRSVDEEKGTILYNETKLAFIEY